jgi:hypothetical protein
MYWGNGTLWYVKLNENMTSYAGSIVTITPKPTGFTEGPWFYKRNDLYYMVYAGMGSGTENIQYATSSSPTGPWASKGIIIPHGSCFTNHPGICDFKDKSYFFYHNRVLSNHDFKRSVCVEQFTYKNDGTIPSMTMSKTGPDQIGNLSPYDTVQAETICWSVEVKTESCSEGGVDVTSIENGDYIKVKGVNFETGAKSFDARVASASNGGNIELRLGSLTGTLVGTCAVSGTGGLQKWTTVSCSVSDASGIHDLYLKFTGGSSTLFNCNWWKFTPIATGALKEPYAGHKKKIEVVTVAGTIPSLRLSFSSSEVQGELTVRLFDITGRLVMVVFAGRPSASPMVLSLNHAALVPGFYFLTAKHRHGVSTETILIR